MLALILFAGTVSHTVTVPTLTTYQAVGVQFPGFDRTIGYLESVTCTASVTASGTFGIENTTAFDIQDHIQYGTVISTSHGLVAAYNDLDLALPPFDGIHDNGGASGTVLQFVGSDTWNTTYGVTPFNTALFHQPTFTVTVQAAAGLYFLPPEISSAAQINVTNNATITLTYNYSDYPEVFCGPFDPLATCPCGPVPSNGDACPNSLWNRGAYLLSSGQPSVSASTFTIAAHDMPMSTMALCFEGTAANYAGSVFGDGLRCVAGSVRRCGVKQAVAGSTTWDIAQVAQGYRAYQVWYRDPASFCTAATFNMTNAVGIQWGP